MCSLCHRNIRTLFLIALKSILLMYMIFYGYFRHKNQENHMVSEIISHQKSKRYSDTCYTTWQDAKKPLKRVKPVYGRGWTNITHYAIYPYNVFVRFVDIFRPDIYNSCLFIQCITSLDMTSIFNLSVMPVLLGNGDGVRKFGTIS